MVQVQVYRCLSITTSRWIFAKVEFATVKLIIKYASRFHVRVKLCNLGLIYKDIQGSQKRLDINCIFDKNIISEDGPESDRAAGPAWCQ
jgi:hypothetical protein